MWWIFSTFTKFHLPGFGVTEYRIQYCASELVMHLTNMISKPHRQKKLLLSLPWTWADLIRFLSFASFACLCWWVILSLNDHLVYRFVMCVLWTWEGYWMYINLDETGFFFLGPPSIFPKIMSLQSSFWWYFVLIWILI